MATIKQLESELFQELLRSAASGEPANNEKTRKLASGILEIQVLEKEVSDGLLQLRRESFERNKRRIVQIQSTCEHLLEDGSTRFIGFTTNGGEELFVCNLCYLVKSKADLESVDAKLVPPSDSVGGEAVVSSEQINWVELLRHHEDYLDGFEEEIVLAKSILAEAEFHYNRNMEIVKLLRGQK